MLQQSGKRKRSPRNAPAPPQPQIQFTELPPYVRCSVYDLLGNRLKAFHLSKDLFKPACVASAFEQALQANASLETLSVHIARVRTFDAAFVASLNVQHNTNLRTIKLDGNNLCHEGLHALFTAVKSNPSFEALRFHTCHFGGRFNFPELFALLDPHPSLQAIDLSETNIGKIDARGGELRTVDYRVVKVEKFESLKLLMEHSTLKKLVLRKCHLKAESVAFLANALQHGSQLTALDVSWNDILSKGCLALANAIRFNGVLQSLDMSGNRVGVRGFQAFANALESNTTLQHLNLHKSKQFGGVCGMDKAIRVNKALESLDISDDLIDENAAVAIASALQVNSKLHTLNLTWNPIGVLGTARLYEALQNNSVLRELTFDGIDPSAGALLANIIRSKSSLTTLDLNQGELRHDEGNAIAAAMEVNQSLKTLTMNRTSTLEAKVTMFSSLKTNSTLEKLELSGKNLSINALQVLAEALKVNTSLKTLVLGRCTFCDGGRFEIVANALQCNSTLTQLDLSWSELDAIDWNALTMALKSSSGLEILHLDHCSIGDDDVIALADMLVGNRKLLELHLYGSRLYPCGAAALRRALEINRTLRMLSVSESMKSEYFEDCESNRSMTRLTDVGFLSVVHCCKALSSFDAAVITVVLRIASSHIQCQVDTSYPDSLFFNY